MQTVVGNVICCLCSHQSMILFSKSEIWSALWKSFAECVQLAWNCYHSDRICSPRKLLAWSRERAKSGMRYIHSSLWKLATPSWIETPKARYVRSSARSLATPSWRAREKAKIHHPRSKRTSLRHLVSGSNVLKQYICWLNEQKSSHVDNEC